MRPPILFIHGAFSTPSHFLGWIESFSQAGFDCHAPALPGHSLDDSDALTTLSLADYFSALQSELMKLPAPPVIVGHSMGGLLAQQLAAAVPCRALVCVASAPPWILTAQIRSLPYLLPMMPRILAGLPIQPSHATLRYLALHDLPDSEQSALLPTFVSESGRAYRAMILGLAWLGGRSFTGPILCLSGTLDRIISPRTSAAIAHHYGASHEVFNRGHWLIASSARDQVTGRVVRWLDQTLG